MRHGHLKLDDLILVFLCIKGQMVKDNIKDKRTRIKESEGTPGDARETETRSCFVVHPLSRGPKTLSRNIGI